MRLNSRVYGFCTMDSLVAMLVLTIGAIGSLKLYITLYHTFEDIYIESAMLQWTRNAMQHLSDGWEPPAWMHAQQSKTLCTVHTEWQDHDHHQRDMTVVWC
jgi:Tfp pilus assembly protein PilV